ncbi:MAG: porin, partial [Aquabacterium sp.]|uniref:porin n=1 Tax=Aquabacterium sp. TaxID=1872578 RepID=UPI002721A7E7
MAFAQKITPAILLALGACINAQAQAASSFQSSYNGRISATASRLCSPSLGRLDVNGAFVIGAGYQSIKAAEAPKADLSSGQKQTFALLGASYDFGVVKLFGQYGQFKNEGFALTDRIDTKLYQVGAS